MNNKEQDAIITDMETEFGTTYDEVVDSTGFSSDGHGHIDNFEDALRAAFESYKPLSLDAIINEKQIADNAGSFYTETK